MATLWYRFWAKGRGGHEVETWQHYDKEPDPEDLRDDAAHWARGRLAGASEYSYGHDGPRALPADERAKKIRRLELEITSAQRMIDRLSRKPLRTDMPCRELQPGDVIDWLGETRTVLDVIKTRNLCRLRLSEGGKKGEVEEVDADIDNTHRLCTLYPKDAS